MDKVYLIPGLGADCRIYQNIELDGYEVHHVNWIQPELSDSLETYAQKLIDHYDIQPGSIVIGNSMGGMVSVEIAKKINLKKTILISSIKCFDECPAYFAFFRRVPVHKILTEGLFKRSSGLFKRMFGNMNSSEVALFSDMLYNMPSNFLLWAIGAILNWKNTTIPPNTYHITGNSDRIFSYLRIKDASIIEQGTHLMILHKAKEINTLLKDILSK